MSPHLQQILILSAPFFAVLIGFGLSLFFYMKLEK